MNEDRVGISLVLPDFNQDHKGVPKEAKTEEGDHKEAECRGPDRDKIRDTDKDTVPHVTTLDLREDTEMINLEGPEEGKIEEGDLKEIECRGPDRDKIGDTDKDTVLHVTTLDLREDTEMINLEGGEEAKTEEGDHKAAECRDLIKDLNKDTDIDDLTTTLGDKKREDKRISFDLVPQETARMGKIQTNIQKKRKTKGVALLNAFRN